MRRFSKGMVKDTGAADQPEGTWRYARNAVVNRVDGAISTEGGTEEVTLVGRRSVNTNGTSGGTDLRDNTPEYDYARPGYTPLGTIEVTDDRIVIFSVNEVLDSGDYGRSEVGVFESGTYNTVLNPDITVTSVDTDLKFSSNNPISGTYKVHASGDLFIYWTDNVNPPRALNVTRQFVEGVSNDTTKVYGVDPDTSPNKNYIDRLNLYPHSGPVPKIEFKAVNSGGGLTTGVYALALAYVDVDLVVTNFLTVDNPVPITTSVENTLPIEKYDGAPAGSQTGKSITWDVSNINTDYDYLRAVVIQTVGGERFAYQLNDAPISGNTSTVTFTGVEGYTQAAVEDVIIDTVSYDTVKSLEQVDGVLYEGNLKGSLDVGFQRFAGDIKLKPKLKTFEDFDPYDIGHKNLVEGIGSGTPLDASRETCYRGAKNAYKYRGYPRGEVYAVYIAFIMNNGSMSYAYHIPGRKAVFTDLDSEEDSDLASLGDNPKKFNFNTSTAPAPTDMNYWENDNEYYPNTADFQSSAFKEKGEMSKVRHHHFPNNADGYAYHQDSTNDVTNTANIYSETGAWYSPAGGSNVEYNSGDINDLGFSADAGTSHTAMKVSIPGEGLVVGDNYQITWQGGGSQNTFIGVLEEALESGWHLFDKVSGNKPNAINNENNWKGATIVGTDGVGTSTLITGSIKSTVRALGFELTDIKVPVDIAEKVQGFRIYYAKREHKNKTVLGQGIVTPYVKSKEKFGGCNVEDGNDIDGFGSEEDIWTKFPFVTSAAIENASENFTTMAFYNFELLRSKESIAGATHVSIEGKTLLYTWIGGGYHKKGAAEDSCEDKTMWSTVGIMKTITPTDYNAEGKNRVINSQCKTYVKGNSIFDARGLGFDAKLNNRGGESHIALNFKGSQSLPFKIYEFGSISEWQTENEPFSFRSNVQLSLYIVNLRAYKTDVYNSFDLQTLVWTGFEVTGDDFENFIEGGSEATYDTAKSTPEGIFGGDTFICRYGVRQSLSPRTSKTYPIDRLSLLYTIIETTDNLTMQYEEGEETSYFPGSPARKFLFGDREGLGYDPNDYYDYTKQDNIKYNTDYSAVNDIRPAIPLPTGPISVKSFPTRVQRSAKSDPGSFVDNFRVHLALQYKDLPKNRGNLSRLAVLNNLLYIHMEDSLFVTKGKEKLQVGDSSEAFIGSGDVFQQNPEELIQTEAGYGGTRSQSAGIVTRYGYFSVDDRNKRIYLTSDKINDISNLGMEKWFQDNMGYALHEQLGYLNPQDNPISGVGYTAVWDEKYTRILLTKRDLSPTEDFKARFNAGRSYRDPLYAPYTSKSFTAPGAGKYENPGAVILNEVTGELELKDYSRSYPYPEVRSTVKIKDGFKIDGEEQFTRTGWTISYYPEHNYWGSFHDYTPAIYTYDSSNLYSFSPNSTSDNPYMAIYKHDVLTSPGEFYGGVNPFEVEVIDNTERHVSKIFSSFGYETDVYNNNSLVFKDGFTSFFAYNSVQCSGEKDIAYFTQNSTGAASVRKVANQWRINNFRDMASVKSATDSYFVGTLTFPEDERMFTVSGMSEILNSDYTSADKPWHQQKKFTGTYIGIRLISDNTGKNLVDLYSTSTMMRKYNR